jgi:SP family facilitated glucose transporter-like MFS transporter 8
MRISTGFCIIGWLAVFFSKVYIFSTMSSFFEEILQQKIKELITLSYLMQSSYTLDLGRFFTGYGIGVISYVVIKLSINIEINFNLFSFNKL